MAKRVALQPPDSESVFIYVGPARANGKNDACAARTGPARACPATHPIKNERSVNGKQHVPWKEKAGCKIEEGGPFKPHAKKESAPKVAEPAASSSATSTRPRSHHKTLKLEEALREQGIDEQKVAQGYSNVHEKLGNSGDKGDLKLFVDVLKENSRILEPPRPPDRSIANDGPVTVILKHNVPRPSR